MKTGRHAPVCPFDKLVIRAVYRALIRVSLCMYLLTRKLLLKLCLEVPLLGAAPQGFGSLAGIWGGLTCLRCQRRSKMGQGSHSLGTTCCSSKKFHEEKRVGLTPRRRVAGWSSTGTKGSGEGQVFAMILSVGACFAKLVVVRAAGTRFAICTRISSCGWYVEPV